MKRNYCIILFLLVGLVHLQAQSLTQMQEVIKVTSEHEKDEYAFYVENRSHATYSVSILFKELRNLTGTVSGVSPNMEVAPPGKYRIFSLKPEKADGSSSFSYSYSYMQGNFRAKVDTNYVYLLPVKPGKEVRVLVLTDLKSYLVKSAPQKITGIGFGMAEGDTVCAVRSGIVVEVKDHLASAGNDKTYVADENQLAIQHNDGSIAMYRLFRDNGFFVEEGDKVVAGQPIGIVGGDNYELGPHLRFYVYYLRKADRDSEQPFVPRILLPAFHLAPSTDAKVEFNKKYQCEHPQEYILKEMTKSQRKKYLAL